nr:uncharacterized protein LOC129267104 [Lytechinus pictus]
MLSATSKMEEANFRCVGAGRERAKGNWQTAERNLLLQLITERREVLLCRKTDYNSNLKKTAAWDDLANKFHSKYGNKWSTNQIKDQWKRMRLNAKKEHSNFSKESRKTGGGPPPPEPSHFSMIVKELCPMDFQQFRNPFDDDNEIAAEYLAFGSLSSMATGRATDIEDQFQRPQLDSDTVEHTRAISPSEAESHDSTLDPSVSTIINIPISRTSSSCSTSQGSQIRSGVTQITQGPLSSHEERTPKPQSRGLKRGCTSNSHHNTGPKTSTRSSEERLVELAEEEHQIRLEYMRIEHEFNMEILKVKKKTEEAKLKAALSSCED